MNLLLNVPLVAGCAISIVDVLLILIFYNPDGSLGRLRYFETFVMLLVFGVVICFCIQLSMIENTSIGDVFRGYLPSSAVIRSNGYVPFLRFAYRTGPFFVSSAAPAETLGEKFDHIPSNGFSILGSSC